MERIIVEGGSRLNGRIAVSGAKNAVLPIIVASLLSQGNCRIQDVPLLADVETISDVLSDLGAQVTKVDAQTLDINCQDIKKVDARYDYVRKMRASVLVMGPLLARQGRAKISMPGGCAIGTRPIDLHLKGFEAMGVRITMEHGYMLAETPKKLTGARIYLDYPSVGATENILMAAALAEGTTVIENAAEEPEIVDLANYVNSMGGRVKGAGTNVIKIEGVKELGGTTHTVIPDRIEAGSYMVAAAATGSELILDNVITDHLKPVIAKLLEAGVTIREESDGLYVKGPEIIKAVDIKTLPYPGFPTDMQAQFMALMAISQGTSIITETVFENRFMHAEELRRMGADIKIEGRSAVLEGVSRLTGAPVKASDLRAGASLIIAGLVAEGETDITNIFHIDRGYDNIVAKLKEVGAKIRREEGED